MKCRADYKPTHSHTAKGEGNHVTFLTFIYIDMIGSTSSLDITQPGAKTIKKNTNSTQNKSQTHRAKQYEVTSFLNTDCELSTETCSKNIYSLGP